MKIKEVFKITIEDKELELAVVKPSAQVIQEANIEYGRTFNRLLKAGVVLQQELEDELRKRGLWDDEKQQEYEKLQKEFIDGEYRLDRGGIKLSEGVDIAKRMRKNRQKWQWLVAKRVAMQTNTAEAQADQARFNFMVQRCLVYNETGEQYFKTLDDYYNHSNEEIAIVAAIKFSVLTKEYDENMEANLPENKFLKEWGLLDDKLRLVDKQGRLVDEDGNLVDEEGFLVDVGGNRIDINGNPINVEKRPFLDEDGNPLTTPT